ncbi:hypothetical protein ERJ75_001336500 [Trypanosoma vivax]|uniref:Uncharacterized protein n=1 Tax=Trypanosoma vivax (strain Y486) TaxID=1055687 RepID=G0U649_TRYVY|nr:hypothetical protein TRVL_06864 [Trypanosoma vivax]KAH8607866.1 hypothetical protein ERJ75_001336500 [Trypanosoma vivax]CCC51352.1 conserved hypothetical protein [Trypanosoma vivax Y486]
MPAALVAARAAAQTILWESLRLNALQGAVPHVLLVVDQVPCTLQKVLLEGYLCELNKFNTDTSPEEGMGAVDSTGSICVSLDLAARTPCFSCGFVEGWRVTYGVLPFTAGCFLDSVRSLQAFLRQCGEQSAVAANSNEGEGDGRAGLTMRRWSEDEFARTFESLATLLGPRAVGNSSICNDGCNSDCSGSADASWKSVLLNALRTGPQRELLGCILVQRNAFQLELEKYRLRLDLFNMGLRVAEHNHLEVMSATADALIRECSGIVGSGDDKITGNLVEECLKDNEIVHYMRSCSFKPGVAESIGRAIANSIDMWSWSRKYDNDSSNGPHSAVPPASFAAALTDKGLWSLYGDGVLSWKDGGTKSGVGASQLVSNDASVSTGDYCGRTPPVAGKITGPGAPLRIFCHSGDVLCYEGGMEDCLLNTGYYPAAHAPERNCVSAHRRRFPTEEEEVNGDEGVEKEAVACEKRGRLKKKEYLALLKATEKKRVERGTTRSCDDGEAVRASGSDADRGGNVTGACVGSSIGGTFPVGEVISESFDLSKLNGSCTIFAYPSLSKTVTLSLPKPAVLTIRNGIVTDISADAPEELIELIELVRQTEGSCYVRELGIGLSPFLGRDRVVSDVTAFERQFGVHLSLGQRHPLFVKQAAKRNDDDSVAVQVDGPVLKRKAGKYHIDVFLDASRLEMGDFSLDFTKGLVGFPTASPITA